MLFTKETRGRKFSKDPAVVHYKGQYFLYYSVIPEDENCSLGVGIASSTDMENWTHIAELALTQECEKNGVGAPAAIVLNDTVHLFYQTYGNREKDAICHATSTDGVHFEKDPTNPIFRPTADWCCGRAIDADIVAFHDQLFLYFATRDHEFRIQKVGGAVAALNSGFHREDWTQLVNQALVAPEFPWEEECIEAPATIVNDDKIYLFYGGAYNCAPQQIGVAVSEDGVFFRKVFNTPFLANGPVGAWNESESGHPYAFRDDDGKAYLFYQGSPDKGKTWILSRIQIDFTSDGKPYLL